MFATTTSAAYILILPLLKQSPNITISVHKVAYNLRWTVLMKRFEKITHYTKLVQAKNVIQNDDNNKLCYY